MGHELVSRPSRLLAASLLGLGLTAAPVAATLAGDVTIGAALRAGLTVTDPDSGSSSTDMAVQNVRLYINGKAADKISYMFNTDYTLTTDGTGDVHVIDAAAQFAISDQFNLWAGRMLAPSARSNLYGAYYSSNAQFLTDNVQDSYPQHVAGRDDGVMYWGQYGITKVAIGVFDNSFSNSGDLKAAGRVQLDLWDPEGGYYQNGTYYGGKDLLALGFAAQTASGDSVYSLDFLMEKKLSSGGVVTLEAEYDKTDTTLKAKGCYALAAYMFPSMVGWGKFQVLGKYGTFSPNGGSDQNTLELNLNYIIKDQNARVSLFYLDNDTAVKKYGLVLQIQI